MRANLLPTISRLPGVEERFVISVPCAAQVNASRLPPAEREVAEGVLQGKSNREIAERRGTSVKTVANQLARLFERFDVHSRTALVRELEREPAKVQA